MILRVCFSVPNIEVARSAVAYEMFLSRIVTLAHMRFGHISRIMCVGTEAEPEVCRLLGCYAVWLL
jgi:hypothetical protein